LYGTLAEYVLSAWAGGGLGRPSTSLEYPSRVTACEKQVDGFGG